MYEGRSSKSFSIADCHYFSLRSILVALVLTVTAYGQITPHRIQPDDAAKHLISKPTPTYPSAAQTARIQGNVVLEINIDESGTVIVHRLVMGHPMLVQAAVDSASRWKYHPFEIDGKPSSVVTLVTVTFGTPGKDNDVLAHSEMLFQDTFWTAEEAAQAALIQRNYAEATLELSKAHDALGPVSDGRRHESERWQLEISMGHLAMAQQKNDEAEQHYKKAEELRKSGDKEAPETAETLAELGRLYAAEKRYELARDYASRSIGIYKKNFKKVNSTQSGAASVYGRAIAYQSWMLSKIALQQNNPSDAAKQCQTVLEFQSFLAAADRDAFVSACQQGAAKPSP